MLLEKLSTDAEKWLQINGYTESTIYCNYVRFWNGLKKQLGPDTDYTFIGLSSYIISKFGRNLLIEIPTELKSKEYRAYHALRALDEFFNHKMIHGTSMSGASVRQMLTDVSESTMQEYMNHIHLLDYATSSKKYAYNTVHQFLTCCPIETMQDHGILTYLNNLGGNSKQTVKSVSKVLRRFLTFCKEKEILAEDYSCLILSQKNRRNTVIPSVYTTGEVAKLAEYLKIHGKNKLRNFTIVILIAVFGFRAGDIASMNIHDIDWDKGVIRIIQSKTKVVLEHKLTSFTGDVLAEYLLKERPVSESAYVFLKSNGERLNPISISTMITIAFTHCGIIINGRKQGSHSLRHSLASNMLADGTGILAISKTLGHSSVDTTRIYAKVDINHLRLCELEVPVNA